MADIKSAAEKSPQVCYFTPVFYFTCTGTIIWPYIFNSAEIDGSWKD